MLTYTIKDDGLGGLYRDNAAASEANREPRNMEGP